MIKSAGAIIAAQGDQRPRASALPIPVTSGIHKMRE